MSQRPRGKIWKCDQKVVMDENCWKTWKSNQKIVMDEELVQDDVVDEKLVQNSVMNEDLVQNGVTDGKFVKNFVMDAKIDPKVVVDLSSFKIGGWNSLQPINQKFVDRNSKQRSIPCDTVFGTALWEFRSAHEEIDVTS